MWEVIKNNEWSYESTLNNLKEIDATKVQMTETLRSLNLNPENSFYKVDTAKNTISYDMNAVKAYLETIKDKSWDDLTKTNVRAWILAVQIALEALGKDVGTIDGVLSSQGKDSQTKRAVRAFQRENGLTADWAPGTNTIKKLLEKMESLWNISQIPVQQEPDDIEDQESLNGSMIEWVSEEDFNDLKEIFTRDANNGNLRFVMRNNDWSIKKNSRWDIIIYSVLDNNESYYVWDQSYIWDWRILNWGHTSYDTWFYKLVRKNLDCGQFSSLFSSWYENLMDEKSQEILNKDPKDRTNSDLRYLWGRFSTWTHPIHLQQLWAWLTKSSDDLSWWKNFLDWCERMKEAWISTKKLTLRNRFALSAMWCDNTSDFIEEWWFQKKFK